MVVPHDLRAGMAAAERVVVAVSVRFCEVYQVHWIYSLVAAAGRCEVAAVRRLAALNLYGTRVTRQGKQRFLPRRTWGRR
jgi:hypothetical protein